jgi:hypothetical protein
VATIRCSLTETVSVINGTDVAQFRQVKVQTTLFVGL